MGKDSERWDVVTWANTPDFLEVCTSADLDPGKIAKCIKQLSAIESRADRAAALKRMREGMEIGVVGAAGVEPATSSTQS